MATWWQPTSRASLVVDGNNTGEAVLSKSSRRQDRGRLPLSPVHQLCLSPSPPRRRPRFPREVASALVRGVSKTSPDDRTCSIAFPGITNLDFKSSGYEPDENQYFSFFFNILDFSYAKFVPLDCSSAPRHLILLRGGEYYDGVRFVPLYFILRFQQMKLRRQVIACREDEDDIQL